MSRSKRNQRELAVPRKKDENNKNRFGNVAKSGNVATSADSKSSGRTSRDVTDGHDGDVLLLFPVLRSFVCGHHRNEPCVLLCLLPSLPPMATVLQPRGNCHFLGRGCHCKDFPSSELPVDSFRSST